MQIAKWIILIGFFLIIAGVVLWVFARIGVPLGKLPGDLHMQKEKFSLYFPIATSLIISIVFTLLLNFLFLFVSKK